METPTPRSLVEARLYESEAAVLRDALRYLLRARPDLRINLAVHRYTTEDISLAKAAHLAGIIWPEMRDILRERGIPLRLGPESIEDARQEVQAIEGHLGRHAGPCQSHPSGTIPQSVSSYGGTPRWIPTSIPH